MNSLDQHPAELDLAVVFDHFPGALLIVDNLGRVESANEACTEFLNFPKEQVSGQPWPGLDAHLTLIDWKQRWKALQTSRRTSYHTNVLTGSGLLRPVLVNGLALPGKKALLILQDELPKQLHQHELSLLSKQTALGHWRFDGLGKTWFFSPICRDLFGIAEDEVADSEHEQVLQALRKRICGKSWMELEDKFRSALKTGQAFEQELLLEAEQTNDRLLLSAMPIQNALQTTHVVGTLGPVDYGKPNRPTEGLARFALDHAQDMIFWVKADSGFTYVNQQASEQLQYTKSELEQLTLEHIMPAWADNKAHIWRQLRSQRFHQARMDLKRRDGTTLPVSASITFLRFDGQEIACCYFRDITDLIKRGRRRKLYEFTVDNAHELILWVRPDGYVHFANDTFLRRTGYSRKEVEQRKILHFFPTSDEQFRTTTWDDLRRERVIEMEIPLLLRNGTTIPVHAQLNYIVYKGEEFDCLFLRDWTSKKERDARLQQQIAALEAANECIVWLDSNLRVINLNRALLDLIGGTPDRWREKRFDQVFPPLKEEQILSSEGVEISIPSQEGHTVYLDLSFTRIDYDQERYYMIVARNFTERYMRRKQLKEAYQKIEDLSARLKEENIALREEVNVEYNVNNIVTVSRRYQKVLRQVGQVADTDTTVLILGETGTGKELLARAVHNLSERAEYPLIKVNCATLPENLIESELFGHEKGAFTGAQQRKKGRFELADGGTLFLDEIGEMPMSLQPKLLRVLQEGEFERVGGTTTISVNVRLIAATNRKLEQMVAAKQFRSDLYYRLNVFPIVNIPLRERPEDIPVLTEFFVRRFAREQGKTIKEINAAHLKRLRHYHFPGNVRELENIVERAVVLCNDSTLDIPLDDRHKSAPTPEGTFLTFDEMQRNYILQALKRTGGRITGPEGAGRLLGLNDRTLMSKMRKFKIEKREYIV